MKDKILNFFIDKTCKIQYKLGISYTEIPNIKENPVFKIHHVDEIFTGKVEASIPTKIFGFSNCIFLKGFMNKGILTKLTSKSLLTFNGECKDLSNTELNNLLNTQIIEWRLCGNFI